MPLLTGAFYMKTKQIKAKLPFSFAFSSLGFGAAKELDLKPPSSRFSRFGNRYIPFSAGKMTLTVVVLIILIGMFYFGKSIANGFRGFNTSSQNKFQLPAPKATMNVNREFVFPLKNQKGEEVAKVKYFVQNIELRDLILIRGVKSPTIKGKLYLVLNLKITNDYSRSIQINTKDYIRLIVNNNEAEKLAPEIHNDPVEVQATSTKFTRVGFTIDEDEKRLKLKVGEVEGEKTTIDLKF